MVQTPDVQFCLGQQTAFYEDQNDIRKLMTLPPSQGGHFNPEGLSLCGPVYHDLAECDSPLPAGTGKIIIKTVKINLIEARFILTP